MKGFPNKHGDVIVLQRGEELHASLTRYAQEHGLTSAWVQGLGGSGTVTLGYYHFDAKEYEWQTLDQPLEILNLTGNLATVDGEPFWHIHGSFGQPDCSVRGGHVKELVVGLTCELLITALDTPMSREYDDETGLRLLCKPAQLESH